jgi:hypothetical protein
LEFIDRYKAEIITFLLTGIVILAMFSIKLKQQGELITESYYEIEPEPELPEKLFQEPLEHNGPSTDKAFNEDEEYKKIMQNFKTVSPNDFEDTTKRLETSQADNSVDKTNINESLNRTKNYALKAEETESFKKLQEALKKRLENKNNVDEHASSRSTLTYSLKNRVLEYYKTPRYLCEYGGSIVVNIRVNQNGEVYDAYVNKSSTSTNQCLVNHAIDYAKTAKFNKGASNGQIGTITFVFKGKS